MSELGIHIEGLSKRYGEGDAAVDALKDVNMRVAPGEVVGLIGPSGSGKSSLLMLMGGLERATTGRVMVQGADLSALDEDGLARFRRGRVGVVR